MKMVKAILILLILISCQNKQKRTLEINKENPLELIAESDNLWTGLAISKEKRIFVNFPRWDNNVKISVGEIINGKVIPYPNKEFNHWTADTSVKNSFICVQSVYIDDQNYLWILDPSNPLFQGVINLTAKLYKVNLNNNQIIETHHFDSTVIYKNSYLNDVRVDTEKQIAYITDSGVGSIIVTNLKTGESKRLLEENPSVTAHFEYLTFGENRIPVKVDADGIALSNDRSYLYYTPLTSHTLYRIKTEYLINGTANKEQVEAVTPMQVATDGIMFDNNDNLYLGGLENNSINIFTNNKNLVQLVADNRIKWADSFAKDIDGNMYFTTSQLHLSPIERGKYAIYKINMK
jgi:sugar lactone lactonase YvrE